VAHQRLAAAQRDVGGELLAEGGLPDARLAHHHGEGSLARQRGIEGGLHLPQLRLAPDEDPLVEGIGPRFPGPSCVLRVRLARNP
jgi:hypothetical protein